MIINKPVAISAQVIATHAELVISWDGARGAAACASSGRTALDSLRGDIAKAVESLRVRWGWWLLPVEDGDKFGATVRDELVSIGQVRVSLIEPGSSVLATARYPAAAVVNAAEVSALPALWPHDC